MYIKFSLQFGRLLILIGSIIGVYFLLTNTIPYIYPIILAILFAYLLNPLVDFLQEKLHLPRFLSSIIAISCIFIIFVGIIYIVILEIYQGTLYLADKVPNHFKDLVGYLVDFFHNMILPVQEKILSFFLTLDPTHQTTISNSMENIMNHIATTGATFLQESLTNLPKLITALPSSITIMIFIILGTFFISNDWYFLKDKLQYFFPQTMNTSTKRVGNQFKKTLGGFIKAQFIIIFMSGVIIFMGLVILNVEHALTIALFSAIVDLIPFIGIGMIFVPWIIYLFVTANYSLTISLSILYGIVIVSRQVLEPKILSSSVGVHPLVALFGYFIGFKIWGMLGLLIAPCILILINVFYQTGIFRWMYYFVKG